MANNFTPVGAEIQVNLAINNNQRDADVAAMADGRFAVVYERDVSGTNTNIQLQFVNADGTHSGVTVPVEAEAGLQLNPVVTARNEGGVTVVWQDLGDSDEIHFATVTAAGLVGSEQNAITGSPLTDPDAAALDDGRVLVVATQGSSLVANFIEADGTGTTGAHVVDPGGGTLGDAAVAASGNRALVVFWDQDSGDDGAILGRLYDGDGSAPGDYSPRIAIADTGSPGHPDVAALADGRYIVVWEDSTSDDLQARFVDANGTPLGSVFTIANFAGDNESPRVAALDDLGFVVTWENDGGLFPTEDNSDNRGIVARRFDKDGNPAGDLFLVNAGDPSTAQDTPAIAVNRAAGTAYIAWDDAHVYTAPEDDSPDGVRGHAYAVATDVIEGTDDDDVIDNTYGLGEIIKGLKGRDRIEAGGGDDTLDGGKGSDDLKGEAGADTFVFDNLKGVDRLDWENGERLRFDSDVFKKPDKLGELKGKYFVKAGSAKDGNDFFVYSKQKGELSYDKNADGKGKSVLVAKLEKGSDLDAGEIVLF